MNCLQNNINYIQIISNTELLDVLSAQDIKTVQNIINYNYYPNSSLNSSIYHAMFNLPVLTRWKYFKHLEYFELNLELCAERIQH